MASFKSIRNGVCQSVAALFLLGCFLPIAEAQQQVSGFALERLYQSAPGGGGWVMDDLNISGELGGAIAATSGYERNPLVITFRWQPGACRRVARVVPRYRRSGHIFPISGIRQFSNPSSGHRHQRDARPISVHSSVTNPRDQSRHHLRYSHRRRRSLVWTTGSLAPFRCWCASLHSLRKPRRLRDRRPLPRHVSIPRCR